MYYKNTRDDIVSGLPLAINIFIKLREEILQGLLKTARSSQSRESATSIMSAVRR